ncbi:MULTISPECIES: NUDIX domain-containing protein [unclassified Streptomyces]|uniref:NUDIX domain-containing protein n=1 Tax=unclassified Streptomyces TaxID=2593676 RepID=UPI0022B7166B|nr:MULTISPECIES: NUDIX hydrolase [unclassified Streptomyces]MCZ7414943.1 NUDIX hydrolase [Streptomyces sp. WMMC897]MCZ7431886.1 NUDIX hydrolase [Streptomyces sp. WMMC1477]
MTTTRDESATGAPFPLPQADYLATLPKATIYACVFLTDERGRVVQLRSVFRDRPWQLPGGNMDAGEDPFRTAVRETYEETGLRVDRPCPLLLMHYVRSEARDAPLAKVGFCFDGGTLTDRQIAGIRLDPAEHDRWAVEDWATWERLMPPDGYRRIAAMAEARRTGRAGLLVTEPATATGA